MTGPDPEEAAIMRILTLVLFAGALSLAAPSFWTSSARADSGQSNDDTSKSTVDQLRLGEYWWGAKISKEDLRGKVVLFEIWGS